MPLPPLPPLLVGFVLFLAGKQSVWCDDGIHSLDKLFLFLVQYHRCFSFYFIFAPCASMSSAPKPSTAINLCIDCISTKAVYAGWLQFDSFLYHAMAGFCNQGKSKMTTNLPLCNAGVAVGSLLFDCATREKSQNNNQPVHQIDCFLLSLYFPKWQTTCAVLFWGCCECRLPCNAGVAHGLIFFTCVLWSRTMQPPLATVLQPEKKPKWQSTCALVSLRLMGWLLVNCFIFSSQWHTQNCATSIDQGKITACVDSTEQDCCTGLSYIFQSENCLF